MGYYTQFWGSLKFTRRLTDRELHSIDEILNAGHTSAETEFAPYHWLLKIGPDGWAMQQPCRMTRALVYSPRRYTEHLRLNWRSPSVW